MRVLICCLTLALGSGFAAERIEHANFDIQSIGYMPNTGVASGIIQGIAGVGHTIPGVPCMSCFGAPSGTLVIPLPYQIYSPGQSVTYYFTVQTANLAGTADVTITLTLAGATIQTIQGQVSIAANTANLIVFSGEQIPNVAGAVTITFTTTINSATVQGTAIMQIR